MVMVALVLAVGWWVGGSLASQVAEQQSLAPHGAHQQRRVAVVDSFGMIGFTLLGPATPSSLVEAGADRSEPTQLVTSWLTVAAVGDGSMAPEDHQWVHTAVAEGLADSLGVCRAAVQVTNVHEAQEHAKSHGTRPKAASLTARIQSLIRRATEKQEDLNITRLLATYEVRLLGSKPSSLAEIARSVDQLQTWSKYTELNQLISDSFARATHDDSWTRLVLDDVGYASVRTLPRTPPPQDSMDDCLEELLLTQARAVHRWVLVACSLLLLMTTCAGVSVFAMKQPSLAPSRLNPLSGRRVLRGS